MPDNNRLYTFDGLLRQGIYDNDTETFKPVSTVLIPKIQRPYAQGRLSQTEIRQNFLDDLFTWLRQPEKTLELNFVYGSLTDGTFELLDGQQRLTTLFLLGWYLALYEAAPEPIMKLLGKFSYETRTTSTSFIKKLIDRKLTLDKLTAGGPVFIGTTPREEITSLGWYTGAYSKDSTVTGMLVMLDDIHHRYMESPADLRPTYSDLGRIRFYLQDLDKLGLTDELFIKMNARGLQLTPFENFKAELSGWLRSDPFGDGRYEKEVEARSGRLPFWLFFCSSMDGEWNDSFWTKPAADSLDDLGAAEADSRFFTFIKRWLANRAVNLALEEPLTPDYDKSHEPDWLSYFRYFSAKASGDRYHSFATFRGFVSAASDKGFDIITELTHTLAAISDPVTGQAIREAYTAPWAASSQKPWEKNFEMRPMILFSAIAEFILSQPFDIAHPRQVGDFDAREFRRWTRMVHNVVENRNIDSERVQLATTRQLKDVLRLNNEPVYLRLLDYIDYSKGDSNREFREEAAKIQRIISDRNWQEKSPWEEAFREAEKDPYMTGSVAFYLDDNTDLATYRARTARIPLLFNAKGVEPPFRTGFLLWRAILARDIDWSAFRHDSYIIRITNDVSGNRHLKTRTVWNEAPEVRRLFRDLLDKPTKEEMAAYLDVVAQESNALLFPENWTEEVRSLAEEGLDMLRASGKNGGAMGWLSVTLKAVGRDTMGVWLNKDGVMALYRGSVNCLYLNNCREKFIPELEKTLTAGGFTFSYMDRRAKDNYDRFGLYSGDVTEILISRPLPEESAMEKKETTDTPRKEEYLLYFSPHFGLYVYAPSEEAAARLTVKTDAPGVSDKVYDENGYRRTYTAGARLYYLALAVPDIRKIPPAAIAEIVDGQKE